MPKPKRNQPARSARQQPVDAVLATMLDELKTLKDKVDALSPKKDAPSPNSVPVVDSDQDSNAPSTSQQAAVQQEVSSAQQQQASQHPHAVEAADAWNEPISSPPRPAMMPPTRQQPVASTSLPLVDMVPENIRRDIIRGKDINLAQLLLPARERGSIMGSRDIRIGDETITLKPLTDNRLSRLLTIQEFIKAFNIYKNVICQFACHRREELDKYMSNIIDLASKYPGSCFYEYHLQFSSRSAYYLEHMCTPIDWGIMDERLLTHIVAGRRANACSLCHAFVHDTNFCHLAADKQKLPAQNYNNKPCQWYNSSRGCTLQGCTYQHCCTICRGMHSRQTCNKQGGQQQQQQQPPQGVQQSRQ